MTDAPEDLASIVRAVEGDIVFGVLAPGPRLAEGAQPAGRPATGAGSAGAPG